MLLDYQKILETEYNFQFDEKRRSRTQEYDDEFDLKRQHSMATSFFKYGYARNNYSNGGVNAIASALKRIKLYNDTGNVDWLVDVANQLMLEFTYPQHIYAKNTTFNFVDDSVSITDGILFVEHNLALYIETGNTAYLVEAANGAMYEYMHPKHPDAHYRATRSNESPGLEGLTEKDIERLKEEEY